MKRKKNKRRAKLSPAMLKTLKKIYGQIGFRGDNQTVRLRRRGYLGPHGWLTEKAKKVLNLSGYKVN